LFTDNWSTSRVTCSSLLVRKVEYGTFQIGDEGEDNDVDVAIVVVRRERALPIFLCELGSL
jgi:hypothetical protein